MERCRNGVIENTRVAPRSSLPPSGMHVSRRGSTLVSSGGLRWRCLGILSFILAAGCSANPVHGSRGSRCTGGTCGASGGPADGAGSGIDAGRASPDASARPATPGTMASCTTSDACPPTEACIGGLCQPDPCWSASPDQIYNLCIDSVLGGTCQALCVPGSDPCAGVTCAAGQTCIRGACVPGCFPPDACAGVICGAGEHCDPRTHACVPTTPCDALCPAGEVCTLGCAPPNPCDGFPCPTGEICAAIGADDWSPGTPTCVANPCAGVTCAAGQACAGGRCIDTCNCPGGCPAGSDCELGTCVCHPNCGPSAPCGAPDGCGGTCNGDCSGGDLCTPVGWDPAQGFNDYACECQPDCPAGLACGRSSTPDGCGGICPGDSCPSGEFCLGDGSGYSCQCVPNCTSCGGPDGCGSTCSWGACPGGEFCESGRCTACTPSCTACGGDDGCGGYCMTGACPGGEFCESGTCVSTTCSPACGCGTTCAMGACVPICGSGQTLCGCGSCCSAGQTCDPTTGTCGGLG